MVGVKISLISQHSFSIHTLWGSFRLRSNLCFIKFSHFFIVFLSSVGGRTLDPLLTLALHRLFVWTSNWNQLDSHRRNQNQDGQNVSLSSPSILNPWGDVITEKYCPRTISLASGCKISPLSGLSGIVLVIVRWISKKYLLSAVHRPNSHFGKSVWYAKS